MVWNVTLTLYSTYDYYYIATAITSLLSSNNDWMCHAFCCLLLFCRTSWEMIIINPCRKCWIFKWCWHMKKPLEFGSPETQDAAINRGKNFKTIIINFHWWCQDYPIGRVTCSHNIQLSAPSPAAPLVWIYLKPNLTFSINMKYFLILILLAF